MEMYRVVCRERKSNENYYTITHNIDIETF